MEFLLDRRDRAKSWGVTTPHVEAHEPGARLNIKTIFFVNRISILG